MEFRPGADQGAVVTWLEKHGLATLPLVVGILATGDSDVLRTAFGVQPTGMLPVPEELAEDVASIAVVPPKQLHEKRDHHSE